MSGAQKQVTIIFAAIFGVVLILIAFVYALEGLVLLFDDVLAFSNTLAVITTCVIAILLVWGGCMIALRGQDKLD
jgi:Cu/Ag efflux pump CusA